MKQNFLFGFNCSREKHSLLITHYSLLIAFVLLLTSCITQPPVVKLEKANVLPLQMDSHFAFRKETQFINDPTTFHNTRSTDVNFQRVQYMWPATTALDQRELIGDYLNFYWWNHGPRENVTIRLEYRQAGLGNEVLAREIIYPDMKGSVRSIFKIVGDDYLENGRITSWRAILIVRGHIVALTQSFMWE
ncbi:MAG: hypothetical protein K2W99_07955 [Chthoniobacterales bacterium]|nr:hypothetical protein [Chthoniobacterales bacterium]